MAETQATADEYRRALELRASYLTDVVHALCGPLDESRTSLRSALGLVGGFPAVLTAAAESEWSRNPDPDSRVGILSHLLRRLNRVANLVESHLAHGTRRELTEAVSSDVAKELQRLGVGDFQAVVAHGASDNFLTTFGDLEADVFGNLRTLAGGAPGSPSNFAMFNVPRMEGRAVYWRPLLLGHEVAHVAVKNHGSDQTFDLAGKFDVAAAARLSNPWGLTPGAEAAKGLFTMASSWAIELMCDAHALNRFGPSFIASLAEYFSTIGAENLGESCSHPPGSLRVRILLARLGAVADPRIGRILRPWADHFPGAASYVEPWAQFLADLFVAHTDSIWDSINSFSQQDWWSNDRGPTICLLADRFAQGLPGQEVVHTARGDNEEVSDADLLNAAWLGRVESTDTPVGALCAKAIDSIGFVDRWRSAGGDTPESLVSAIATSHDAPAAEPAPAQRSSAALSAADIEARMTTVDGRLVISPLLQRPKGTGYDLRLGNSFIVFRRTGVSAFDPLDLDSDPRSIQTFVDLAWTDQFVLHPQEVVLAATLEYIALPADLTGQVITRSSYGRLGLLSATAVQIHPNFRGCLTLELVNLSNSPLTLTPGERIAQLVLWTCSPVEETEEKYSCPTGPQFSKVRDDDEADVLRRLRAR